jgi:hypothetical protein
MYKPNWTRIHTAGEYGVLYAPVADPSVPYLIVKKGEVVETFNVRDDAITRADRLHVIASIPVTTRW